MTMFTYQCCSVVALLCLMGLLGMASGYYTNFSVSFESLEPSNYSISYTFDESAATEVYIAAKSDGISEYEVGMLVFIPAANGSLVSRPAGYVLGILANVYEGDPAAVQSNGLAVVWVANRNNPVSGNFSLFLNQTSGNLVLLNGDGTLAWSSGITALPQGPVSMDLFMDPDKAGAGSPMATLLLTDTATNKTLWTSSHHPSHTIMLYQQFLTGMTLVSWASPSNPSEGLYSLVMEPGGLALYYNYHAPNSVSHGRGLPYWILSYDRRNDTFSIYHTCEYYIYAILDHIEGLQLLENTESSAPPNLRSQDVCPKEQDDFGHDLIGQLRFTLSTDVDGMGFLWMHYDGNIYAFTLGSSVSRVYDLFATERCSLPDLCGPYGVCNATGNCECPSDPMFPSTFPAAWVDASQGCPPTHEYSVQTCINNGYMMQNQETSTHAGNSSKVSLHLQLLEFSGMDYFPNKYSPALHNLSELEICKNACLQNCSCLAAFWYAHSGSCFHALDHIASLQSSGLNSSYQAFLKVLQVPGANKSSSEVPPVSFKEKSGASSISKLVAGVASGVAGLVLIISCTLASFLYKRFILKSGAEQEEEDPLWSSPLGLPTRYSYKDLHLITTGFSEQMGKGGFGAVYAGTLQDGSKVAVKRLESLRQGTKEFRAEVMILGSIHHHNLVGLRGFCAEGSHRLLVYEYMPRGSLDQWLFTHAESPDRPPLEWKYRYNIALGVARGLAYLHGECNSRIIHFDIKPQNILLDDCFVAKISDFGLSALMSRDETHVVTAMKGTPGYLAPEWLNEGPLSEKCDVFSFGKLLMEMLGGRRNLDLSLEGTNKLYFPSWLYHQMVQGGEDELIHIARVESLEEMREARFMMKTAFLCVVEDPDLRPCMEKVVHMLEGRAPELDNLQLPDIFPQLHFALKNIKLTRLAQNKIKALGSILHNQSSSLITGMSLQTISGR